MRGCASSAFRYSASSFPTPRFHPSPRNYHYNTRHIHLGVVRFQPLPGATRYRLRDSEAHPRRHPLSRMSLPLQHTHNIMRQNNHIIHAAYVRFTCAIKHISEQPQTTRPTASKWFLEIVYLTRIHQPQTSTTDVRQWRMQ